MANKQEANGVFLFITSVTVLSFADWSGRGGVPTCLINLVSETDCKQFLTAPRRRTAPGIHKLIVVFAVRLPCSGWLIQLHDEYGLKSKSPTLDRRNDEERWWRRLWWSPKQSTYSSDVQKQLRNRSLKKAHWHDKRSVCVHTLFFCTIK